MWSRCLLAGLLVAASASTVTAVDFLNADNGHYYRAPIANSDTWAFAKLIAFQQIKDGQRGHLVTITSAAEQAFVDSNFYYAGGFWTGGLQAAGSPDPKENWQWVTGEPFEYTHWYQGEPNDYSIDEFIVELYASGFWNDAHPTPASGIQRQLSLIVEFTPGYVPTLNGGDFLNWQRSFGKSGKRLGDFTGNSMTDAEDLDVWHSYFGGGTQPAASAPEPSTIVMIATAMCVLTMARRVRRD